MHTEQRLETVPGKPVISGWIRSAGMPSPKLIGPHATLVKVYMLIDSRYVPILDPDRKRKSSVKCVLKGCPSSEICTQYARQ